MADAEAFPSVVQVSMFTGTDLEPWDEVNTHITRVVLNKLGMYSYSLELPYSFAHVGNVFADAKFALDGWQGRPKLE
jgi:hypothetical protein